MGAAQRANPIKIGLVPLEPCPVCGYALSMVDHHCRHCAAASRQNPVASKLAHHIHVLMPRSLGLTFRGPKS